MKKRINIIWSETFGPNTPLKDTEKVLNSAIEDFIEKGQNVLGVELIEKNGNLRFWIYTD